MPPRSPIHTFLGKPDLNRILFQSNSKRQWEQFPVTLWACSYSKASKTRKAGEGGGGKNALILVGSTTFFSLKEQGGAFLWANNTSFSNTTLCLGGTITFSSPECEDLIPNSHCFLLPVLWGKTISLFIAAVDSSLASESNSSSLGLRSGPPRFWSLICNFLCDLGHATYPLWAFSPSSVKKVKKASNSQVVRMK